MQDRFDAIILAGYDRRQSSSDSLVVQSGEPHKVLIKIAGKPMIWYVVNALANSRFIDRIVLVGLGPEDGVAFGQPVSYLPDQGSMLDNLVYGCSWLAQQEAPTQYVLLLTGDIPLLTSAMLDWFITASQPLDKDVYWGIVKKQTMEATFPNSKRSYLRLVEGQFCSGDLFLGKISAALGRQALIKQMVDNRKSVLQQLRLLGFRVVLKFLLRRLRMQDLLDLFSRLLGLTGDAVILPFAEVGMDVDKPHQLAQVLTYLETHPQATTTSQVDMDAPHA